MSWKLLGKIITYQTLRKKIRNIFYLFHHAEHMFQDFLLFVLIQYILRYSNMALDLYSLYLQISIHSNDGFVKYNRVYMS